MSFSGKTSTIRQQAHAARPVSGHVSRAIVRRRTPAAAAAPPGQAQGSPAELQQLLARKEAQLAELFQPGRTMPRAAEVAAMRSEIAALADQLAGRPVRPLVTPGPPGPSAGSAPSFHLSAPSMGTAAVGTPPPPSAATTERMRSRTEELAFKAYDQVEEQLRSNQGMGNSDDIDVAQLEAENTTLRAEAFKLLQRQQQLETMWAEVQGAKPPEMLLETTEGLLARMRAKLAKS
eukprot:GHRR01003658.1.p1 GENE.GHRR01003658.1~~GHRR01003658.1.p1  ORF type:complete len:234 (+),score=70.47 GHRR01003658.1:315-1016(+)